MSLRMLNCAMLFCVSFSFLSFSTSAENVDLSHQIQPLAQSSLILDIASLNESAIAVGERGHILIKKKLWQQVKSPVHSQLTKVYFIDDRLGWAVGHDATILHTQDGGLTWAVQLQSFELEKPFFDVFFFDDSHGVAVGAYGMFYRTQNGGETWHEEFHQELLFEEDVEYLEQLKVEDHELYLSERAALLPHFNRFYPLSDGRFLLVGELGLVAFSDDLGRTFQQTNFSYEGSIFNVIEYAQQVYVMGLRGNVFKTNASLHDWQSVKMPIESTLNGAIVEKGNLFLVGNAGAVVKISPSQTVELVVQKQGENIVAINKGPLGQIWLAGTKGLSSIELQ